MYVMSFKEYQEYDYLKYKHIFEEKSLTEDEQKRFDELSELFIKECEKRAYWDKINKEEKHKKEIFNKIKPLCKFSKKIVKKCQSRQTGEKCIFWDIEIESMPLVQVFDMKTKNELDKWNKIRGRSQALSMYACYKNEMAMNIYIMGYFLPGIQAAYDDYVQENFYGKYGEYFGEPCKNFQLDWFDEVFVSKEKYLTGFQKWFEDIKYYYQKCWKDLCEYKFPEPESWERAWIDSVEYETRQRWYYFCTDLVRDLMNNEDNYSGIKNKVEYLKEAEKILHKKLL